MCRLYGFHSSAPRKVECELIDSQNSLIAQSERDEFGHSNPDGWGLVTFYNGEPHADRQVEPAYQSERFRWAAARAYSKTVLAHVRKATVGTVGPENTHPFVGGKYALVHNGTIGAFSSIKERFLAEIPEEEAARIRGTTDSEHFFHLLVARHKTNGASMADTLRECCEMVSGWVRSAHPTAEFSLNVVWTDGKTMVGSRLGRSLWFTRRDEAHVCEICGTNHTRVGADQPYHAVVLASERITHGEKWEGIEEGSIFEVQEDCDMRVVKV